MLSAMLRNGAVCFLKERSSRGVVLLEGVGSKKALFIGFNRFFILHMGVKRSTIRVSTLKEMK
jgi:hypothetical protein